MMLPGRDDLIDLDTTHLILVTSQTCCGLLPFARLDYIRPRLLCAMSAGCLAIFIVEVVSQIELWNH